MDKKNEFKPYIPAEKITPEINAKVEDTLNEWFGAEYELVEG